MGAGARGTRGCSVRPHLFHRNSELGVAEFGIGGNLCVWPMGATENTAMTKRTRIITCVGCDQRKPANVDSQNDTCQDCWDEAGLENEHSDNGHATFIPECPTCREGADAQSYCDPIAAAMALEISGLESSMAMVALDTANARLADAAAAFERATAALKTATTAVDSAMLDTQGTRERIGALKMARKALEV